MNKYAVQSYFHELCNMHYSVYRELKRLKKASKELEDMSPANCERQEKWTDYLHNVSYWNIKLNHAEKDIMDLIKEVYEMGQTIMLTRPEEALALVNVFTVLPMEKYKIINEDEEFPKDQLSTRFLLAYLTKDQSRMYELYVDEIGKSIL